MTHVRLLLAAAATAALGACTNATPTLSLSPVDRTLQKGLGTDVKIFARSTVEDGEATPLGGAVVTLTLDDPKQGRLEPATVTLGADGRGTVKFTLCDDESPSCAPGKNVVIKGTVTVEGEAVTANAGIKIATTGEAVCPPFTTDCSPAYCRDTTPASTCKKEGTNGTCSGAGLCEVSTVGNAEFEMSLMVLMPDGQERTVYRAPIGGEPFKAIVKITKKGTVSAENQNISFEATNAIGEFAPIADGTYASPLTKATDATGTATVFFKPASAPSSGSMKVTFNGLVIERSFDVVRAGTLVFAPAATDAYFRVMGVKTSGWREQNLLRFRLLDAAGNPYVGKAEVDFALVADGTGVAGAQISPLKRVPVDENGEVTTTLYSSSGAGTLAVRATAWIPDRATAEEKKIAPVVTTSDTIAIVGAKASGREFAVRCEVANIPSLTGEDCSFMRADIQTTCTAQLGDRFHNTLGRDVRVNWSTEAALFGPPSFTGRYDPDADALGQDELGRTSNYLTTLNTRMPRDVAPVAGEKSEVVEDRLCSPAADFKRTRNPRDGLNTIIAHTQGEEGFVDQNGDGVYTAGEFFFDLGEPYVDANDTNARDGDEEFIDVNGNGAYDGPNGRWDADTTIWSVGFIVFSYVPQHTDWVRGGRIPPEWPANEAAAVGPKGTVPFQVSFYDSNFNAPAYAFSLFGLSLFGDGSVEQTSADHWADRYGSFDIGQVTLCNDTTKVCSLETRFTHASRPGFNLAGFYKAPDERPFSGVIQPSVAVTVGNDTITATTARAVENTPAPTPP